MDNPRQTEAPTFLPEPLDPAFINNILAHRQIVHETGMGQVSRRYLERMMDDYPQVDVLRIYTNARIYWAKGDLSWLP